MSRLHETTYLNPGLEIIFNNKRSGEEESITYYEPDGISAYIRELNKGKETVHDIITYTGMSDGIEVTVAFQFVDLFEEKLSKLDPNVIIRSDVYKRYFENASYAKFRPEASFWLSEKPG